jgi:hypothetical protein
MKEIGGHNCVEWSPCAKNGMGDGKIGRGGSTKGISRREGKEIVQFKNGICFAIHGQGKEIVKVKKEGHSIEEEGQSRKNACTTIKKKKNKSSVSGRTQNQRRE